MFRTIHMTKARSLYFGWHDITYTTSTNFLSMDGAVVRALASHQCDPGSIPGPGVICGLSLLLVLYSALRGFSPGTPVFSSPQKPTFTNSNWTLECTGISNEFLRTPGAPWVNKLDLQLHYMMIIIDKIASKTRKVLFSAATIDSRKYVWNCVC